MNTAKTVVVSGGSAGVGRAVVQEFANNGYNVAVFARGATGVAAAASDVTEAGGQGARH